MCERVCSRQGPALFQGINKRCRVLLKGSLAEGKRRQAGCGGDASENLGRAFPFLHSAFTKGFKRAALWADCVAWASLK